MMMQAPRENKLTVTFVAITFVAVTTSVVTAQCSSKDFQIQQLQHDRDTLHAQQTATAQAPTPAPTAPPTTIPASTVALQPTLVPAESNPASNVLPLVLLFVGGSGVLIALCVGLGLAARQPRGLVQETPLILNPGTNARLASPASPIATHASGEQTLQQARARQQREWAIAAELRRTQEAAVQFAQDRIRLAEMELELAKMRNQAAHSVYPPGDGSFRARAPNGIRPSGNDNQPISQIMP
jgi:hypothetical protein